MCLLGWQRGSFHNVYAGYRTRSASASRGTAARSHFCPCSVLRRPIRAPEPTVACHGRPSTKAGSPGGGLSHQGHEVAAEAGTSDRPRLSLDLNLLWGEGSEVQWPGTCFVFQETTKVFSEWLHHLPFPPGAHEWASFSTPSPAFGVSLFLIFAVTIGM